MFPICKHGSKRSCTQLRSTVICQQNTNPPGVAQLCPVSSNKPNNKLTLQAYPNSNKHVTQQIEDAPGINKGQQNRYKVCKSTSDHKLETPKANPEVIKIGSIANTTKPLSVGVGSAKHESKQYYAHHYNLVSPAKQSNFHQHSQAIFRPQPNVSRVKPKPINEENVQHISNLSCANTGESQLVSSGTGSLKWLDRLPLVETLNATVSNPMHASQSGAKPLDWIGRLPLLVKYSTHAPRSRLTQRNETGKMNRHTFFRSRISQQADWLNYLEFVRRALQ